MKVLFLLSGLLAGAGYATWRLKGALSWIEALRALHPRAPRFGSAETQGGGGGPQEPL